MYYASRRRCRGTVGPALAFALASLVATAPARAIHHLWELSELYSNDGGTVQFVEMHNDFNSEGLLNGTQLTATNADGIQSKAFTLTGNLPSLNATANHYVLIATAGFAGLPGGVTPNYTLPAGFLFTGGGTLTFSGSGDSVSYASLPTDGTMSLTQNLAAHTFATAVNSPTNFAGVTGSVPEPAGAALALVAAAVVVACRGRTGRGRPAAVAYTASPR